MSDTTLPNDTIVPTVGDGLTKREYFALQAMKSLLTNHNHAYSAADLARDSVWYADALIHKLNR